MTNEQRMRRALAYRALTPEEAARRERLRNIARDIGKLSDKERGRSNPYTLIGGCVALALCAFIIISSYWWV